MGEGESVGVSLTGGTAVTVAVNDGVTLWVTVEVGVRLAVGVAEGVTPMVGVGVGVEETVAVRVAVVDGVTLKVTVEVGVRLAVAVTVGVAEEVTPIVGVGVRVRVGVPVNMAVRVAVTVEPLPVSTTSCGAVVPSREEKVTPSLLSATRAKVKVPLPLTSEVTLYSTQALALKAPLLSTAPLRRAGWVFHVTPPVPDSVQALLARWTAGPLAVPFVEQKTRRVARWTGPVMPLVVKRMKLFCFTPASPSA
jgi:hypothetical protein